VGKFKTDSTEVYDVFSNSDFITSRRIVCQIAADSQNLHKSQSFGLTLDIGNARSYQFLKGEPFQNQHLGVKRSMGILFK